MSKKSESCSRNSVPGPVPEEVLAAEGNPKPRRSCLPSLMSLCGVKRRQQSYEQFTEKLADLRIQKELDSKSKTPPQESTISNALTTVTPLQESDCKPSRAQSASPSQEPNSMLYGRKITSPLLQEPICRPVGIRKGSANTTYSEFSHSIVSTIPHQSDSEYPCSLFVVNTDTVDELAYRILATKAEIRLVRSDSRKYRFQSEYFDEEVDFKNELIDHLTHLVFWRNFAFKFNSLTLKTQFVKRLLQLGKSSDAYENYSIEEVFFLMCRIYELDEKGEWQPFALGRISLILQNIEYALVVVIKRYDNYHVVIPLLKITKFKRRTKSKLLIEWKEEGVLRSIKLQFITHEDDFFYRKVIPIIKASNPEISAASEPQASATALIQSNNNSVIGSAPKSENTIIPSASLTKTNKVKPRSQSVTSRDTDPNSYKFFANDNEEDRTINDASNNLTESASFKHDTTKARVKSSTAKLAQQLKQHQNTSSISSSSSLLLAEIPLDELSLIVIENDQLSLKVIEQNSVLKLVTIRGNYFFETGTLNEEINFSEQIFEIEVDHLVWSMYKLSFQNSNSNARFIHALFRMNTTDTRNTDCFNGRSHYIAAVSFPDHDSTPKFHKIEFVKHQESGMMTLNMRSANKGQCISLLMNNEFRCNHSSPSVVTVTGIRAQSSNTCKISIKLFANEFKTFVSHLIKNLQH